MRKSQLVSLFFGVLWLLFVMMPSADLQAQSPLPQWTEPRRITGVADEVANFRLIPDHNGQVHLFWSQRSAAGPSIYHATWDGTVWSTPVDILISPIGGESRFGDALIDEMGMVHLVFYGGDITNGHVYYTRSHVTEAGTAHGWSAPRDIAGGASGSTAIDMDGNGRLVVLYGVYGAYTGVSWLASVDNGDSWQSQQPIFRESKRTSFIENLGTVADGNGSIHAVWSIWENTGSSAAVIGSRLLAGANGWDTPWTVGQRDEGDYEADWPNIMRIDDQELMIIWQDGGFPPVRTMRITKDGGDTWSEATTIFDVVGENGTVADVAVDSSGQAHAVTHGRYGFPNTWHGVFYYPLLANDEWGERVTVTRGKKENEFDPTYPTIVANGGNQLLVVYGNDPKRGIWFSYANLDTPAIAPQPYPELEATAVTPVSTPSAAADDTAVSDATQPPQIDLTTVTNDTSARSTLTNPLWIGSISGIFLILIVIFGLYFQKQRNH